MENLFKKDLSIYFMTKNGDKINLHKGVSGDYFRLELPNNNILLVKQDVIDLGNTLYQIEKEFDSYYFREIQYSDKNKLNDILPKLSNEKLMALAKFNDEKPREKKIFTLYLRTELFKRNGLSKANYKLTFKQKAFLFAHGLSRI